MPYKSRAQMRAFFAMEGRGRLPKGTVLRWAHHTPGLKGLPEHIRQYPSKAHKRQGRKHSLATSVIRRRRA